MLVHMTWNPSERQLRQFGLCALVALPLTGWCVLGRTAPATWQQSQAIVFGTFAAAGLLGAALGWLRPRSLKWVFVAATLATIPIGMVVGELMMLVMFFGIFTPVAFLFRLTRRDVLQRRFEPATPGYWAPKAQAVNAQHYFRQS
jgi:hypothetical protein